MSSVRPSASSPVLQRTATAGSAAAQADTSVHPPIAGSISEHPGPRRGRLGLPIMAITLIVLIFLAGFGTWSLRNNRTSGRREARQTVLRSARVASAFATTLIGTLEGDLQLLSIHPVFATGDPTAIAPFLQGLIPLQQVYTSGISWIDASGLSEASSMPSTLPPVDVSDRDYFRTALKGKPTLSQGLISRRTRQHVLVFAVPTHGSNGVNGVLTGSLQLSQINTTELKQLFGTLNLTAYDSGRHLVLGPRVENLGSKIPAPLARAVSTHTDGLLPEGVLRGPNDSEQVIAFAKVKNPDWVLAVQEPADELYGAVDHQYGKSLALLLGLSLVSFLGAAFAASRLDTWHRRVADERARLAAVIDHLPAGVAVVGPDARIQLANPSALDALGALGGMGGSAEIGGQVPPAVLSRITDNGAGGDDISVVLDGVERFFAVRSTVIGRPRDGVGAVTLVEETTSRQADERRRVAAADLLAAISVSESAASIAQAVVDRTHDAIGCDWCALSVVGSNDGRLVTLASDQDPAWRALLEPDADGRPSIVARAVAEQRILDVVAHDHATAGTGPDRTIVLPLQSAGRAVGAVAVGFRDRSVPVELGALAGFAAQVALALDRARRREIEHDVSLTLQRTLLASTPVREVDLSVALRYQPAADQMLVGGDFYDVIALDGVSHLLLIGDVVGHGLEAATTMGQLKIAIRAFAQETRSPARILSKLDEFVRDQLESARYSTAAMVVVDRADGVLRAAVAGHPPPLVRQGDGTVSALRVVQQPLLGLPPTGGRRDLETPLTPGATGLCLYTDGLIERPDLLLDDGIARLSDALSRADGWDVERTAEQLMALVGVGPHRDDVALLYALIHA